MPRRRHPPPPPPPPPRLRLRRRQRRSKLRRRRRRRRRRGYRKSDETASAAESRSRRGSLRRRCSLPVGRSNARHANKFDRTHAPPQPCAPRHLRARALAAHSHAWPPLFTHPHGDRALLLMRTAASASPCGSTSPCCVQRQPVEIDGRTFKGRGSRLFSLESARTAMDEEESRNRRPRPDATRRAPPPPPSDSKLFAHRKRAPKPKSAPPGATCRS